MDIRPMQMIRKVAGTALLAGLVAGCSTYSLKELRHTTPSGTPFDSELMALYRDFATQEEKQYDWYSSMHFADKGLLAAYGKPVEPEMPEDWRGIPSEVLPVMLQARQLVQTYALSAANKRNAPKQAARALFYFDCWVEEQHENWQHEDIARCRDGLGEALERLGAPEIQLAPMVDPEGSSRHLPVSLRESERQDEPEATPVPASTPAPTPGPTVIPGDLPLPEAADRADADDNADEVILLDERAAAPPPQTTVQARLAQSPPQPPVLQSPFGADASGVDTSSYMVFFDDNRTGLPEEGRVVADAIIQSLKGTADYSVVIGAADHVEFAERRAQAVREYLVAGGVDNRAITVSVAHVPDFMADSGEGDSAPVRHRVEIYLNQ